MNTFTFIIGSVDDFESAADLEIYVKNGGNDCDLNCSIHEFEAPEECDEDTVVMIGRGIAFSEDWALDESISYLVRGSLKIESEEDMFNEADEGQGTFISETQRHDLWEL
jgi:hypothetical protein